MNITGKELNIIVEATDGSQEKYTIEKLFEGWDNDDDAVKLKKKLKGYSIKVSDDGTHPDHDGQMYDNFITFFSPLKKKTKIKNRHCLMTGFNFSDRETFKI